MNPARLVVVDICNTLFDSNTTFDFLDYCVDTKKIRKAVWKYRAVTSRRSPVFWLLAVLHKATKRDYHKTAALRLLKDTSPAQVKEWSLEFFDQFLQPRLIVPTNAFLEKFPKDDVVLVSSTIEPVAAAIATRLGFQNYLATRLAVKDGVYTGEIDEDISGKKTAALQHWLGRENVEPDVVITDNLTDRSLLLLALNKYAVCYNRRQETFWRSIPGVQIFQIGY